MDALKRAGVTDLVLLSACGSFREELTPGTFVLVNQFIDCTVAREHSLFETGCVALVAFAEPVSPHLMDYDEATARAENIPLRRGGTYLAVEGPQFSTGAESHLSRSWGCDVIGMTNMPEAKLAREAELCYAPVAMVTDYDSWHPDQGPVEVSKVNATLLANAEAAKRLVVRLASALPREHEPCPTGSDRALDHAIITPPSARDPELVAKLDAIAGRVLRGRPELGRVRPHARLSGHPYLSTPGGRRLVVQRKVSNMRASVTDHVAIVIPMLNEEAALPRLLRTLSILDPPPAEIIAVDGGSLDASVKLARESCFLRVVEHARPGRPSAINRGVAESEAPLVCVLHVDTILPDDAVAVIRRTLADPGTALAGFTPIIAGAEKVRWGTSFHNWIKTWYVPLLFRPHLFLRGGRLLFGDHAMFFRRADFVALGGCDETLRVMEDADLCIRLCRRGRVRLVNRVVITSDRRVAAWGALKANLIYLYIGIRWGLGLRRRLERHYPEIR